MQFAKTGWVRMIAWGLLLIVPAALLHLAGCGVNRLKIYQNSDPDNHAFAHPKALLHGAAALLMTAGVFIATLRQPGTSAGRPGIPLACRVLSLVVLLVWLIAGAYALDILKAQPASYSQLEKTLALLALLSQGAPCILLAFHCSRLAARLPNDTLRTHAYYTGWLCALVCATLFGLIALEMDRGLFPLFFMCSFPLIAGMLVIILWAMITLIRLALDLRTTAAAVMPPPTSASNGPRDASIRPSPATGITSAKCDPASPPHPSPSAIPRATLPPIGPDRDHAPIERVAFHRHIARLDNQPANRIDSLLLVLVPRSAFALCDVVPHDGAIEIVHTPVQRHLRELHGLHDPERLHVVEVVEHQPRDGEHLEVFQPGVARQVAQFAAFRNERQRDDGLKSGPASAAHAGPTGA